MYTIVWVWMVTLRYSDVYWNDRVSLCDGNLWTKVGSSHVVPGRHVFFSPVSTVQPTWTDQPLLFYPRNCILVYTMGTGAWMMGQCMKWWWASARIRSTITRSGAWWVTSSCPSVLNTSWVLPAVGREYTIINQCVELLQPMCSVGIRVCYFKY